MKSKILSSKRSKSKKAVRSKSKKATRSKSKNTKRNIIKKAIKKGGAPHESLLVLMNIITCPISREIMIDPVITADGMTYEKEEIKKWLHSHNTSPLTGSKLENKKLIPNNSLKQVINDIVDQGFLDYKTVTEYLTKKGLNKLDIMTMRSKIYEQKMKNRGKDIFTSPENKDYKYTWRGI